MREMAEDGEFMGFHEVAAAFDARKFVVGVEAGRSIAGEVFSAAENAGGAQTVIECGSFFDGLGDIAAVAAPA